MEFKLSQVKALFDIRDASICYNQNETLATVTFKNENRKLFLIGALTAHFILSKELKKVGMTVILASF